MPEPVDHAREAYEWKRFATLMFRIAIALCVALTLAVGLIFYFMQKGCA